MDSSGGSPTLVVSAPLTTHAPGRSGPTLTRPVRILAVDPGTRYMGVAFLVGPELIRADVEHGREPGMATKEIPKKAQVVLRRWIEHYEPDVIAVEQAFFAQSKRSRHLQRITQAITIVAKAKCLPVQLYPPTIVRRLICKQGRPTRLAVARVIATEYFPWLQPYYDKEAKKSWWRKHYWTHLFDAIAVGLACQAQAGARRTSRRAA